MNQRTSNGRLVLFILLGLILGGILGESLGFLFGTLGEMSGWGKENAVANFFVQPWNLGLGYNNPEGVALDLYFFKFKFGFGFRSNVVSILGLLGAMYIEKWSRGR